uniref:F-box domain-containing protein n=1 Tax=Schizophyllum commune (strain H4-8 / FGSC 9210) TaxID=578458 RepID=D8QBL0_SCHCM
MEADVGALLERATPLANVELHRGGYVPDTDEEYALRRSSREISAKMLAIDSEIQMLSVLRGKLSGQLELNQALLAPVRRLPNEILFKIFTYYAHPIGFFTPFLITRTVACVSRAWRAAARGTPGLWTSISSRTADMTGMLPLQLSHPVSDDAALQHFTQALDTYASRWQFISFHGSCSTLRKEPRRSLPSLEAAAVTIVGPPTGDVLDFLADAPALKDLKVVFNYLESELPETFMVPSFPELTIFPTLTHLSLSFNSCLRLDMICPALDTCRGTLISLTLSMAIDSGWGMVLGGWIVPITMTALATIELGSACYEVLEHIDTPALQEITIRDVSEDMRSPFPALTEFASRTHPSGTLTRLNLWNIEEEDETSDSLLLCLDEWGGLQELCVVEPENHAPMMPDWAFKHLQCAADEVPTLPNLKAFSLTARPRRPWNAYKAALEAMILSRESAMECASEAVVALERVDLKVDYVRGFPPADSKIMQWVLTNDPAITLAHPKSVQCFIEAIAHNPAVQLSLEHVHLVAPEHPEDRSAMLHALLALFSITRSAYTRLTPRLTCIYAHGPWTPAETRMLADLTHSPPSRLRALLPREHPLVHVVHRTVAHVRAAHPPAPRRPTTQEKIRDALSRVAHLHLKRRAQHTSMAHAHEMAMRSDEEISRSAFDTREMRRTFTNALAHLTRSKASRNPKPKARTVPAAAPWFVSTRRATALVVEARRNARPSRAIAPAMRRIASGNSPRRLSISAYFPVRRGSLSSFFPLSAPMLSFSLPCPPETVTLIVVDQTMKVGQTLGTRAVSVWTAWPLYLILFSLFLAYRTLLLYGSH